MTSAAPAIVDRLGQRPGDVPGPLGEQLDRPVEGLGLHVLRQRDGDRAGLDRVGEHAHRAEQRRRAAARAGHTRSKYRDSGRKASLTVTSRGVRQLELLQHRALDPGREGAGRAAAAPGAG